VTAQIPYVRKFVSIRHATDQSINQHLFADAGIHVHILPSVNFSNKYMTIVTLHIRSSSFTDLPEFVVFRLQPINMSSMSASTSTVNNSGGFLSPMLYAEKAFNAEAARQWTDSTKTGTLWLSAAYVIVIFAGQKWMHSRSPFDLRIPLFLWSAVLSIFSIIGTFRTLPQLYNGINDYGWTYSMCDSSFYLGSSGFWYFVFVMSKAWELGDTLFIVLRRQPLIFLHWYHHFTVLIYCFYTYAEHASGARWYIAMNFFVHSVMYTYYALRAIRVRVPSFVRMSVTILQMLQMAVGIVVSLGIYVNKRNGFDCHQTDINVVAAILMFGSYLVLFGQFFYLQYASPSGKKPTDSDKKVPDLSMEEVKKLH